jgi:hypothetical protein
MNLEFKYEQLRLKMRNVGDEESVCLVQIKRHDYPCQVEDLAIKE